MHDNWDAGWIIVAVLACVIQFTIAAIPLHWLSPSVCHRALERAGIRPGHMRTIYSALPLAAVIVLIGMLGGFQLNEHFRAVIRAAALTAPDVCSAALELPVVAPCCGTCLDEAWGLWAQVPARQGV